MEMSEDVQSGLERREHHLRTLHDISKELFAIVDIEKILRNFLMMVTGNFGVIEAFIITMDNVSKEITHFEFIGFGERDRKPLVECGGQFLMDWDKVEVVLENRDLENLIVFPQSVSCVLPFLVNGTHSGLLGLGAKLVGEPYNDQDKELLVTLVNNLIIAVRNAIAFEDIKRLNLDMQEKHNQLEKAFNDLDRRVYHLKTLNDVSKDIFGSVDFKAILKNFLLISMGNFGVIEGLILTLEMSSGEVVQFESNGYEESDLLSLKKEASRLLLDRVNEGLPENLEVIKECQYLKPNVACGVCFKIDESFSAFLGLGPKLIGDPYSEDDKELLVTLSPTVKTTRSFWSPSSTTSWWL